MLTRPALSLVVPLRDAAAVLPRLLKEWLALTADLPDPAEIVLVSLGSRDATPELIRNYSRTRTEVCGLQLEGPPVLEAALEAGFRAAAGERVVTLRGDGADEAGALPDLLAALDRADFAYGVRPERRVTPAEHRLQRRAVRGLGEAVPDPGCGWLGLRRPCLARLKLFAGLRPFLPLLLAWEGWTGAAVPLPGGEVPPDVDPGAGFPPSFRQMRRDLGMIRWFRTRSYAPHLRPPEDPTQA